MNETENKEKQQIPPSDKAVSVPSGAKKQKLSGKEKKALLKLYRRGKVSDEYLFSRGITEWDFSYFYQCSRKNGLSFKDSFYNVSTTFAVTPVCYTRARTKRNKGHPCF